MQTAGITATVSIFGSTFFELVGYFMLLLLLPPPPPPQLLLRLKGIGVSTTVVGLFCRQNSHAYVDAHLAARAQEAGERLHSLDFNL